jgi:hypothetical protein
MASKTYWFVPKRYGRWFVPVTWQWWLWTLLLIGLIVASAFRNGIIIFLPYDYTIDARQIGSFAFDVFVLMMSSLWFMEKKCSAELKRRWWGK